jgi:sugar phosphate isomerase/epimerase
MKISISTSIFGSEENDSYLITYLRKLVRAGFEYIEIGRKNSNIKKRLEEIEDTGIKVWAVHGTLKSPSISLDEATRKKEVEKEMRRMYDTAHFAPCPYVIHYLDRFINTVYGVQYRKSVEELLQRAKDLGFILAIETAPYKPELNERYPASKEISDFVRSFDDPSLQMTIDINHSNVRENLDEVIENCKGLIANVHISDNHGRGEQHLPPGQGTIDIRRALEKLVEAGYQGPCNLECHHPKPTTDVLRYLKEHTEKLCEGLYNGSDSM